MYIGYHHKRKRWGEYTYIYIYVVEFDPMGVHDIVITSMLFFTMKVIIWAKHNGQNYEYFVWLGNFDNNNS